MEIEADFSGEIDAKIVYEAIEYSSNCRIILEGKNELISIVLSFDQFQMLTDQLGIWGYEPSDEAKKQIEKIKNES